MSPRRPSSDRLTALWLALTISLASWGLAPGVSAQPDLKPPSVRLVVEELTTVLRQDQALGLRLRVSNHGAAAIGPTRIEVSVHRRVRSRVDYQGAVDDGLVGSALQTATVDLLALAPGESQTTTLPAAGIAFSRRTEADPYGVYPLRIRLRRDQTVVDELHTSVVVIPAEVPRPLRITLLWPLDHPPGLQPDGSYASDFARAAFAADGRLRGLLAGLDGAPELPVALAPSGLLLAQASDLADGYTTAGGAPVAGDHPTAEHARAFLGELAAAGARPGAVAVPDAYGPADLVALVRGGMGPEAQRQVRHGALTVGALTGAPLEPAMFWPADALDSATIAAVAEVGIERLILAGDHLAGAAEQRFSPEPIRSVALDGDDRLLAYVPDSWLTEALGDRLGGGRGEAVAAQRVLAETAVVYFERPFSSSPRGLVLAPPRLWHADPAVLRALTGALASAPWLAPVPLPDLATGLPAPPAEPRYPEEARARELPRDYIAALRAARLELGSLAGVLPDQDDAAVSLDRRLLAAASVHYRPPPRRQEGLSLIRAVADDLARSYAAIEVVDSPPVTLTSAEGAVPVTLRNTGPAPLTVRVRLETPRYEFRGGPVHRPVRVPPGATTTLTFSARALSPGGTNPVAVVVEDPAGGLVLARGTMVVRSTAYSILTLVITGGAGLFLFAWWLTDAARRRRARSQGASGRPGDGVRDPAAA